MKRRASSIHGADVEELVQIIGPRIEIVGHRDLALGDSERASTLRAVWNKVDDGQIVIRNCDALSVVDHVDELGELRLRLGYIHDYSRHT